MTKELENSTSIERQLTQQDKKKLANVASILQNEVTNNATFWKLVGSYCEEGVASELNSSLSQLLFCSKLLSCVDLE